MSDTLNKIQILVRAEITLARIRAQRMRNRAMLAGISGVLLLTALIMINVGAYQLLSAASGVTMGAFLLAAINGALGLLPLLISKKAKTGPEEKLVQEIHDMALSDLTADVQDAQRRFAELGQDVKNIQSSFNAISQGGLSAKVAGLAPLLGLVIEMLKRKK